MAAETLAAEGDNPTALKKSPLQQFCLLAKTAHGAALLELVRQVLESPGIYLFGDLLNMPNVKELEKGENAKFYNTLNVFAYGTVKQYRQNPSKYIQLTPPMQKKLQHLTIVSLAIENKSIPYALLMEELEINSVRGLEDLIIEAIYADIIHGKMFQKQGVLEVDYVQGRDIPSGYIDQIENTLTEWLDSCKVTLKCIDEQIENANAEKSKRLQNKERIETEINTVKKTLKNQMETDETMQVDSREGSSTSQDARKKPCKAKATRPSSTLKFSK